MMTPPHAATRHLQGGLGNAPLAGSRRNAAVAERERVTVFPGLPRQLEGSRRGARQRTPSRRGRNRKRLLPPTLDPRPTWGRVGGARPWPAGGAVVRHHLHVAPRTGRQWPDAHRRKPSTGCVHPAHVRRPRPAGRGPAAVVGRPVGRGGWPIGPGRRAVHAYGRRSNLPALRKTRVRRPRLRLTRRYAAAGIRVALSDRLVARQRASGSQRDAWGGRTGMRQRTGAHVAHGPGSAGRARQRQGRRAQPQGVPALFRARTCARARGRERRRARARSDVRGLLPAPGSDPIDGTVRSRGSVQGSVAKAAPPIVPRRLGRLAPHPGLGQRGRQCGM